MIIVCRSALPCKCRTQSATESCLVIVQLDRFIPSRSALDVDVSSYNLLKENASAEELPQRVGLLHRC